MKLAVQVKLLPSAGQAEAMRATLHAANDAANRVSKVAHEKTVSRNFALRKHTYEDIRAAGLGSQAAQHVIKKVADAYRALHSNIKNGNYGINRYRRRQLALRRKLQAKQTRPARRVLKRQRRKEQRRGRDINHRISKHIVTEAERTGRGIALEDLTGIRARVRHRKPQRVMMSSWSFAQLGSFIEYKAQRAGVPVVNVDPAYTSKECADCHHTQKANRVNQALFICRDCGVVAHADRNASRNIAARAAGVWDAGRQSSVPAAGDCGQDVTGGPAASQSLVTSLVL